MSAPNLIRSDENVSRVTRITDDLSLFAHGISQISDQAVSTVLESKVNLDGIRMICSEGFWAPK